MAVEKRNLPCEIIKGILLLQPAKSLKRFKTVCKSWNAIISDHDFPKNHLRQSKNPKNRVFLWKTFDSEEYRVAKFENGNFHVETICEVPGKDLLCSGDGLVLLSTPSSKSYMLWNPCSNDKIKIPCSYKFDLQSTAFGICRGPSLDDYKIVAKCSNYYAVFSCKNDSWSTKRKFPLNTELTRKGDFRPDWLWRSKYFIGELYPNRRGLFIDGFSFWVMTDPVRRMPEIVYFDPRDENFKKLQKPSEIDAEGNKNFVMTSLCGCLCLYDNLNHVTKEQLRVWIMRDVDSNSWSELIVINDVVDGLGPCNVITPLFSTENNELVIRSGSIEGDIGVYNSMEKKFEELDLSESSISRHDSVEEFDVYEYSIFTGDSITVPCLDTLFFPMSTKRKN